MLKIKLMQAGGEHSGGMFFSQCHQLFQHNLEIITLQDKNVIENHVFFYTVFVSHPGKSLLRETCKRKGTTHFIDEIPVEVREALVRGNAYLILDSSNEGFYTIPILEEFHNIALELKICPSQIIWLNQNIALPDVYNNWADRKKLDQSNRIQILYYHSFLFLLSSHVRRQYNTPEKKLEHLSSILDIKSFRSKTFLCMNNTPRSHRLLVVLKLLKEKLMNKGLISLPKLKHRKSNLAKDLEIYQTHFPGCDKYLEKLDELEKILPLKVDEQEDNGQMITSTTKDLYTDTYFSLVTETETSSGDTIRFTEKTLKPMINLHPFLVVGNPKTLSLIRSMGFKTFNGFIDESYDDILNPEERVLHVMREVERLCSMTPEEIHDWYTSMLPILIHNAEHFMNYIPVWNREVMGKEILYNLRNVQHNFLINSKLQTATQRVSSEKLNV